MAGITSVLIQQPPGLQETLWEAALISQRFTVVRVGASHDLLSILSQLEQTETFPVLLIADLATEGFNPYEFCRSCREKYPELKILLTQADGREVPIALRQFILNRGVEDILMGFQVDQRLPQVSGAIEKVSEVLGSCQLRPKALIPAVERAYLDFLVEQIRGGLPIGDHWEERVYYSRSFSGTDAVQWLRTTQGLQEESALALGERLIRLKIFHHVTDDQPFRNGEYLYRFYQDEQCTTPEEQGYLTQLVDRIRAQGGVAIKDHWSRFKLYSKCVVGHDLVQWFQKTQRLSIEEAIALGQRLIEVQLLHHVLDEHPFTDSELLYRFMADER